MPVDTSMICADADPGWQSRLMEISISVSLVFLEIVALRSAIVAIKFKLWRVVRWWLEESHKFQKYLHNQAAPTVWLQVQRTPRFWTPLTTPAQTRNDYDVKRYAIGVYTIRMPVDQGAGATST